MDAVVAAVVLLVGLVLGGAVAAAVLRRSQRFATEAALASAGAAAQARVAGIEARLAAREEETASLAARLDAALADARNATDALGSERVARAEAQAALRDERERAAEKLAVIADARAQLVEQFKALAGDALEVNRKRMREEQEGGLATLLKPLGEKLSAFEKKVEETYDKEAQQRFSLQKEVLNLQQATQRINEDANNLTRALKGEAKTRGNWGEVVLERVLERSGLVKGVEYLVQQNLRLDDGSTLRPDVVVRLPDNKHVVIDAKVSLVAYDRYYAAPDDASQQEAGRQHVAAMQAHAKSLHAKNYQGHGDFDTPDFVAMFVPIEPAYGLACALDPELFLNAWERKVVIVTPSTLLAMLTTVQTLWQRDKQTRHAIEIAEESGKLHDQFVLVLDALQSLGKQLRDAQAAFEQTEKRLVGGKGNLVTRIQRLRDMGAKAKRQLPPELVAKAEANEHVRSEPQDLLSAAGAVRSPAPPLTLVPPPEGEPR